MGTFTQERLQKVIDGFVLNGQTVSVEPYGNGHINDTFLLIMKEDGTEKKYILQRMNGDIFKNSEELMENIMRVTSFLKEKSQNREEILTERLCRSFLQKKEKHIIKK